MSDFSKLLAKVDQCLAATPEQSDVVHDLLAFLAGEMLRLNKEKRAVQQEFLDWLIAALKVQPDKAGKTGLEALTGKARLANFPGDYQKGEEALSPADLLDIIQKNKARLGVRLGESGLSEQIEARYQAALARALPLKAALARTDALIDRIVYKLYGLSEEEIGVVEGK
jgi:hypothetical protein